MNKSKYINIIYHYIQNLKQKEKIDINYIFINKIIVDKLIKLLIRNTFKRFIEILNIIKYYNKLKREY